MITSQVQPSKGTTHLVSKEDFCAIVNYKEAEAVEVKPVESTLVDVKYVLATRDDKDLICTRWFDDAVEADKFADFLKSKKVKVV